MNRVATRGRGSAGVAAGGRGEERTTRRACHRQLGSSFCVSGLPSGPGGGKQRKLEKSRNETQSNRISMCKTHPKYEGIQLRVRLFVVRRISPTIQIEPLCQNMDAEVGVRLHGSNWYFGVFRDFGNGRSPRGGRGSGRGSRRGRGTRSQESVKVEEKITQVTCRQGLDAIHTFLPQMLWES